MVFQNQIAFQSSDSRGNVRWVGSANGIKMLFREGCFSFRQVDEPKVVVGHRIRRLHAEHPCKNIGSFGRAAVLETGRTYITERPVIRRLQQSRLTEKLLGIRDFVLTACHQTQQHVGVR